MNRVRAKIRLGGTGPGRHSISTPMGSGSCFEGDYDPTTGILWNLKPSNLSHRDRGQFGLIVATGTVICILDQAAPVTLHPLPGDPVDDAPPTGQVDPPPATVEEVVEELGGEPPSADFASFPPALPSGGGASVEQAMKAAVEKRKARAAR